MGTTSALSVRLALTLGLAGPASALQSPAKLESLLECRVVAPTGMGGDPLDHIQLELGPAGDFDGDGHDDVLVWMIRFHVSPSNPAASRSVTEVQVVSGRDGASLWRFPGRQSVLAAAPVGDIDGDGKAELSLVVAESESAAPPTVRIVKGNAGKVLHSFTPEYGGRGRHSDSYALGIRLGPAGDVDGDKVPDYFLIAPGLHDEGPGNAGQAELLGRPFVDNGGDGFVDLYSGAAGNRLWRQSKVNVDHGFAASAASVGDVDRDGAPDLVVGAPLADLSRFNKPPSGGGFFTLSGRDGTVLCFRPGREKDDALGRAVLHVGDIDGDGLPDVALGTGSASLWGDRGTNEVVMARSTDGSVLHTVALRPCGCRGGQLRSAGDLDGDGLAELVAFCSAYPGEPGKPECDVFARVIAAKDASIVAELRAAGEFRLGPAGSAGDVDGDGRDDLVVCEGLSEDDGKVAFSLRVYGLRD